LLKKIQSAINSTPSVIIHQGNKPETTSTPHSRSLQIQANTLGANGGDASGKRRLQSNGLRIAETVCAPFTILSANICHTWPRRNFPAQRMEELINMVDHYQADILLLQEVWRSDTIHMHRWLADKLSMNLAYSRTNGDQRHIGFEEGLAILTRFPILATQQKYLRSSLHPFARRQALAAEILTPCGKLWTASVHLSIAPWRNRRQILELSQWLATVTDTAVIGGDFNAPDTSTRIKNLKKIWTDTMRWIHPAVEDITTHQVGLPLGKKIRQRIDYLFLKQDQPRWKILDAGRILTHQISDHLAIWTKFAPIE
jgi:endonuclease/exonuclease/phosphatase family metal-dependent hydrolase